MLLPVLYHEIHSLLTGICERNSLGEAWRSVSLLQRPGHEIVALLPAETLPLLVHPFLDDLQGDLASSDLKICEHGLGLRLRVALHVGPVEEGTATADIARAVNEVHRLLRCEPLVAALDDSDPDVTLVAAVLSSEGFAAFTESGGTEPPASRFTEIRARGKAFDRQAWLYVPSPSSAAGEPAPPASSREVTT
ncbi:hypothetical protein [Sphaerisporangium corydalis]|uniref:hypothetical protein n=1 Tax=Sphaerisporangium corydalis TaxID=1441875 RepID=UPI0021CF2318|nr:hypothetical protein [Sphaerisporangium corydalis]